jgi:hypothetical protein
MSTHKLLKEIKDLFEYYGPSATAYGRHGTTSLTLLAPTTMTVESAKKVIQDMDMDPIVKDLAAIMAREISTTLLQANLRPATYAHMQELPVLMQKKLQAALKEAQDVFAENLAKHIRLHG